MPSKPNTGTRIDASELAVMLGITRQHLTRLCRAGRVPGSYRSKGGHWRFRWTAELAATVRAWSRGFLLDQRPMQREALAVGKLTSQDEFFRASHDVSKRIRRLDAAIVTLKRRRSALLRLQNRILKMEPPTPSPPSE